MSVATIPVKLADVAELNPRLPDALDDNELVSFLPMAAVTAETARTTLGEERNYLDVRKGYTPFLRGDVLLAKITPCFENGKIAQATIAHKIGFGSTEFHVVRPYADRADARYLLHFLRQPHIRLDGERKMTGSGGQRRVPEHFLARLEIPLPPLAEQRRIAEVLDRTDALRTKRRAALAQLDSLTQSIFLDMFGDPYRNTKQLATATLGQLGQWQSGGTPPRSRKDYFSGPIPWFSSGELEGGYLLDSIEHISDAALKATSTKLVPRNAVMLGMYDTAALKAAIAGVDCACNQAIAFAVIDQHLALTTYVYSAVVIGRSDFRRLQRGVRQKNLNLSMIRDIRIPLPPITLQQTFAHRIAAIDKLKVTHRVALIELDALFVSLQHRAFRGEL